MRRGPLITFVAIIVVLALGLAGVRLLGPFFAGGGTADRGLEERRLEGAGPDKVAVIRLEGVIQLEEGGGLFGSDGFSFARLMEELKQAEEDDAVRAVVLYVNSPGGSVVASDEIYRKLKKIRQAGKPVVASMGEVAASGGYYVTLAADRILANPSTLTGSIGVIFALPNVHKLAETIGYSEEIVASGPLKDMGNPYKPMSDEARAAFRSIVDDTFNRFVDLVAEARKLSRDRVLKLATGQVYTGAQARAAGLIDDFGGLDEAIEAAKALAGLKEATVIEYAEKKRRNVLLDILLNEKTGDVRLETLLRAVTGRLDFSPTPKLLYQWR